MWTSSGSSTRNHRVPASDPATILVEQQVTAESLDGSSQQPTEAEVSTAPQIDEETLNEAKRQGWVPQEEYSGPADKWVDAETFVKKGKEINALLRKDNDFLKRELAELKATVQEFSKYHAETEKRAYEKAMNDLRQQKKDAISQGDGDRVLEIDDAIDELNKLDIIPSAMIDVSDGLASELIHLSMAGTLGCVVYEDKIPYHETTLTTASDFGLSPLTCAMNGGEEYELLFSISPSDFPKIQGNPLFTPIGHFTESKEGCRFVDNGGQQHELKAQVWAHF